MYTTVLGFHREKKRLTTLINCTHIIETEDVPVRPCLLVSLTLPQGGSGCYREIRVPPLPPLRSEENH